jgi:hypothetical protein
VCCLFQIHLMNSNAQDICFVVECLCSHECLVYMQK